MSSKENIKINDYLKEFADICEKSLTPDNDRQKDGWGIFTLEQYYKSIKPIWTEKFLFDKFLSSKLLVVHSRSAHSNENDIELNQPYVDQGLVFIFNGLLKNVKIKIDGKIGAQKLFNLIKKIYQENNNDYWKKFFKYVIDNTEFIVGMNIILLDLNLKKLNLISVFNKHPDYFTLRLYQDENLIIVCSQPLSKFNFQKLPSETILSIDLK